MIRLSPSGSVLQSLILLKRKKKLDIFCDVLYEVFWVGKGL